jgi:tRNA threonylcarbamoyladenosine biosynthesis protein TsaE
LENKIILQTRSARETTELGKLVGRLLERGCVVALFGELGSGKTQFIKGLAQGIRVDRRYPVSSPSFTLINEYPGRIPLFHFDLYRLNEAKNLEELGYEEYFYGDGITAVEWAERAASLMPSQHLRVEMAWVSATHRQIVITAIGDRDLPVIEALQRELGKRGLRRR